MPERRYAKTATAVRDKSSVASSVSSNLIEGTYNRWYKRKEADIVAYLGRHPDLLRKGPQGLAKRNPILFRVLKDRGLLDRLGYLFDQYSLN